MFMGVRYVRQLIFGEQVRKLGQSMFGRINLLRAPRDTTWGWYSSNRRQVYVDVVRSMLEYAAAARAHLMSATTISKHEIIH